MKLEFRFVVSLLLILSILPSSNLFSDSNTSVVYLKDGSKIVGEIIELIPGEEVKIHINGGSEIVYKMDKVEKIKMLNDQSIGDYAELGIALGSPGGINIAVGHHFDNLGSRLTFGFIPDGVIGMQLSMPYKLFQTKSVYHAIAPAIGFMDVRDYTGGEWTYGQIAYNLNLYGFFAELGLSFGKGDYESPQLMFQIGYLYTFTD